MLMTSRERVQATLEFYGPDRPPRDLWGERAVGRLCPREWTRVLECFPLDFARSPAVLGLSSRANGARYEPGIRTDEWGSVWQTLQDGVSGEPIHPVLEHWHKLVSFQLPYEMIENPALDAVGNFCRSTKKFRLGEIGPGPFERLQFLRGVTNLYLDLAEQPAELDRLIDRVHEFYLRHVELWCQTEVDGITMGDDWGAQTSMLVAPELWRKMFRPLYAEYFDLIHQAGKYVFFHSDGMTRPIIPDLIDVGADVINVQLFCMDIEELGRSFQGQVTFWGEIDRQFVLPFGTEEDVRQAVRRVHRALGSEKGGLIAQLSWTINDPTDNIITAFEEWSKLWKQ